MDRKKFISWGVSFGSLALVSGMVSYLGLTNTNKTNHLKITNQVQTTTRNINQISSTNSQFSQDNSTNNNLTPSPQTNPANQSANNGNIFSGLFDTTTGGS